MIRRNRSGIYTGEIDGKTVALPSVTTVIGAFLSDFSKVDRDILERSRKFGTAVHDAAYLADIGDLDLENTDPEIRPCVKAWLKCVDETGMEIIDSESIIYSLTHRYAGRVDRVARVRGELAIVEIKTRHYISATDDLQTAAYLVARNEMARHQTIGKRYLCYLNKNGTYQFIEVKGSAKDHFNYFKCALALWAWRENHGNGNPK